MKRFRQYRLTQEVRDKYADVQPIESQDFIYPYFVVDGSGRKEPIKTMPGIDRFSIDTLLEDIAELIKLGIDKVLLFGVIPQNEKDERGSAAYSPDNLISRAVKAIKEKYPDKVVPYVTGNEFKTQYVDAVFGNQIYLNHKLLEEKQLNIVDAMEAGADTIAEGIRE